MVSVLFMKINGYMLKRNAKTSFNDPFSVSINSNQYQSTLALPTPCLLVASRELTLQQADPWGVSEGPNSVRSALKAALCWAVPSVAFCPWWEYYSPLPYRPTIAVQVSAGPITQNIPTSQIHKAGIDYFSGYIASPQLPEAKCSAAVLGYWVCSQKCLPHS